MLGPSANTYTVYAVHSPASAPAEEWVDDGHSGDYNLEDTVATVDTDWKVLKPVIVDSDDDGIADAVGFWLDGDSFDYMCCRFSRNDTASLTNPANAIDYTLQVMGVASADIDTTAASGTYTGWSLTFNGGWVSPHSRAEVIADMLCECHSTLQITDQIELHVLSKTAQGAALTDSDLRDFRYSKVTRSANDSSYIAWQESGKPQDRFKKCLVAAKSATDNPSSDTFQIRFVQDSQDVQRIGSLRNQRRFLRQADVSFTGLFKLIRFQPADVVAINDNLYGGSYNIMLDEVWIKPNGDIHFAGTRYSAALDDWGDLTPSAITVATDDTTNMWQPVYAGPDTDSTKHPNLLQGRVRVNENVILDPTDGITVQVSGGVTISADGGVRLQDNCGIAFESDGVPEFTIKGYYNSGELVDSLAILPNTDNADVLFFGDSAKRFKGTYIWSKETKIRSSSVSTEGHGLQVTDGLFIYENKPYENGFAYDPDASYTDVIDEDLDYGIFYVWGSLYPQFTGASNGNSSYPWGIVYAESIDAPSNTLDIKCNVSLAGNLIPDSDGIRDIGDADHVINNAYIETVTNPNGDNFEILNNRLLITNNAVIIDLADTGETPTKHWFVVNDTTYLSFREDTLGGEDIMFKFQTGGDFWANGDVSGATLTDRSASIEFEEKDDVWSMAQSMKAAFDNHDITRLDKKLQAKTKDQNGNNVVGKRPSDLIQVLTECILDINKRLKASGI
jgi:hypothetical protein